MRDGGEQRLGDRPVPRALPRLARERTGVDALASAVLRRGVVRALSAQRQSELTYPSRG